MRRSLDFLSRQFRRHPPIAVRRIAAILATVLFLAPAGHPPTLRGESPTAEIAPQLLAVFIGGMDSDPTPEQIAGTAAKNRGNSGLFQLCGELHDPRIVCEYFNWNGTRAGDLKNPRPPQTDSIVSRIREHLKNHPRSRVLIVGNSWGGHTAWQVADALVNSERPLAIDRMIFLDASSTGRAIARHPDHLPINIKRAVHYYTHNLFCWGAWDCERLRTVDLGDPDLGYTRDGAPAYAATFDFQAHVAAEWDPRIHHEIKRAALQMVRER